MHLLVGTTTPPWQNTSTAPQATRALEAPRHRWRVLCLRIAAILQCIRVLSVLLESSRPAVAPQPTMLFALIVWLELLTQQPQTWTHAATVMYAPLASIRLLLAPRRATPSARLAQQEAIVVTQPRSLLQPAQLETSVLPVPPHKLHAPPVWLDRRLAPVAQPLLMLRVCHALEGLIILQPATQDHVRHVLLVLLASPEPLRVLPPPTLYALLVLLVTTAQALQPTQSQHAQQTTTVWPTLHHLLPVLPAVLDITLEQRAVLQLMLCALSVPLDPPIPPQPMQLRAPPVMFAPLASMW